MPRPLGQPCCCTRGDDDNSGLLRLGYPLPWLLIVVVLGFGLLRLKDCAGEVVVGVLFAGTYEEVLMAGVRRVLVGEMPNSLALGDWWTAGGGESPASVVSIVIGALLGVPLFFGTWRSSICSATRVLWSDEKVSWVRRPSNAVS